MDKKKLILDFIKRNNLAVLSTVSPENTSQSAVLEFGETNDFEIIFDSFSNARKYKNLKQNNNVSLVIGWDENITVQYEGLAEEIKGEEKKKYQKIYWKKNPKAEKWTSKEGMTYFKVKPIWIRYSNLNKHPWEVFEITL